MMAWFLLKLNVDIDFILVLNHSQRHNIFLFIFFGDLAKISKTSLNNLTTSQNSVS